MQTGQVDCGMKQLHSPRVQVAPAVVCSPTCSKVCFVRLRRGAAAGHGCQLAVPHTPDLLQQHQAHHWVKILGLKAGHPAQPAEHLPALLQRSCVIKPCPQCCRCQCALSTCCPHRCGSASTLEQAALLQAMSAQAHCCCGRRSMHHGWHRPQLAGIALAQGLHRELGAHSRVINRNLQVRPADKFSHLLTASAGRQRECRRQARQARGVSSCFAPLGLQSGVCTGKRPPCSARLRAGPEGAPREAVLLRRPAPGHLSGLISAGPTSGPNL